MARRSVHGFNGAKLLALRVTHGLTQQKLSDKTAEQPEERRVGRDTISRYETGEASPTHLNLAALAAALGCQPADLLDEEAGAA